MSPITCRGGAQMQLGAEESGGAEEIELSADKRFGET